MAVPERCVLHRYDGGDGHDACLRNCSAPYKPYFWATSDDNGAPQTNGSEGPLEGKLFVALNSHVCVVVVGFRLELEPSRGDGRDWLRAAAAAAGWGDAAALRWAAALRNGRQSRALHRTATQLSIESNGLLTVSTCVSPKPQRCSCAQDNNVWAADATALAAGSHAPAWRVYSISYWHNRLYDRQQGEPGRYTA